MKILSDRKLSRGEIIFNIFFGASLLALFYLLYNPNTFSALSGNIIRALKFVYLAIFAVIVVFVLFIRKFDFLGKINLKKSVAQNFFTVIVWMGMVNVLLRYMSNYTNIGLLMSAAGSLSLLVLCYFFVDIVFNFVKEFFSSISKLDLKLFVILSLSGIVISSILFCRTNLFTHPSIIWDAFYSYDTQAFNINNWFLDAYHGSPTDCRHLLLTFTMMPFAILPYMLSQIFSVVNGSYMLFMSYVQVLLMTYCIIKILNFLKIQDGVPKILLSVAFMLISASFINTITVDKYVISLFYIIVTLDLTFKGSKYKWVLLALSLGNLTTNIFLAPIVLFYDKKSFKQYCLDILKFCGIFVAIMFVTGQLNLLLFAYKNVKSILSFSSSGNDLTMSYSMQQWLIALAGLYLIPNYEIRGNQLWQAPVSGDWMMYLGIVILAITIVSVILNRKEKFAWVCGYWQLFMFILLAVVGWGATLNEMFLYSALFAWSSFALVVMYFKKIISNKKAQIVVICVLLAALVAFNAVQFVGIMKFAREFYRCPLLI